MPQVTGKEAGALESVATAIEDSAGKLDASRTTAVGQVQATAGSASSWQGDAAVAAQRVATDLEAAMSRHIAKMHEVAGKVRTASKGLSGADTEAGGVVSKVDVGSLAL